MLGRPWWISVVLSLIFLTGLALVWYLAATDTSDHSPGTTVVNSADVDSFLAEHPLPSAAASGDPLLRIPTGVFVQSLEFTTANNIEMSGYIWAKYDASIPADITRGFVLPEALEEAYEAREVDRHVEDGVVVIRWYFFATLRQHFDYQSYPFDRHTVWLRIWHPDHDRNVVLVPDFASYTTVDPEALPGVDDAVVLVGWEPEYAGFSYETHEYTATLGFSPGESDLGGPELYFNVGLSRSILGPLANDIIPTTVVFLLLFVCLSLSSSEGSKLQRSGFDTAASLGFCAALLFVALLAHNQIRDVVPAGQLAYLEEVVMVGYVAIFLVAVNAALLGSQEAGRRLHYRDNHLARLCYWPVVTGLILIVTVISLNP